MPNAPQHPFDLTGTIHQLKQEIDALTQEQSKALQSAIFIGSIPDEARKYDERRKKIMGLAEQLKNLSAAL